MHINKRLTWVCITRLVKKNYCTVPYHSIYYILIVQDFNHSLSQYIDTGISSNTNLNLHIMMLYVCKIALHLHSWFLYKIFDFSPWQQSAFWNTRSWKPLNLREGCNIRVNLNQHIIIIVFLTFSPF